MAVYPGSGLDHLRTYGISILTRLHQPASAGRIRIALVITRRGNRPDLFRTVWPFPVRSGSDAFGTLRVHGKPVAYGKAYGQWKVYGLGYIYTPRNYTPAACDARVRRAILGTRPARRPAGHSATRLI